MVFPEPTIFYTATIHKWIPLLSEDQKKQIIISSLEYLVKKRRIVLFGFVIMPNHIHLILKILKKELEKELPTGSLLKFTAHEFKKELRKESPKKLTLFSVDEPDRDYRFWQDPVFTTEIYTDKIFTQKLDYIHQNPVSGKWRLVTNPMDYFYSSMRFYELNQDDFGILTNYYFDG